MRAGDRRGNGRHLVGNPPRTSSVVRATPEYCYTDVAPVFLDHGRRRFGPERFVSFDRLDIEDDPSPRPELVGRRTSCSPPMCSTRPSSTGARARAGAARPRRGPDVHRDAGAAPSLDELHFRPDPGLRRFDGSDGRQRSPLLDGNGWFVALGRAGFRNPRLISQPDPAGDNALAVFCADADPAWTHARGPHRAPTVSAVEEPSVARAWPVPSAYGPRGETSPDARRSVHMHAPRHEFENPLDQVTSTGEFRDLGLDSILAQDLLGSLEQLVGAPISATVLFDKSNVRALGQFLAQEFGPALDAALPIDGAGLDAIPAAAQTREAAPARGAQPTVSVSG